VGFLKGQNKTMTVPKNAVKKASIPDPFADGANLDLRGFPQLDDRLLTDSSDPFLLGDDVHLVAENRHSLKAGILALANSRDAETAQHLRAAGVEDATANKEFYLNGGRAVVFLKGGVWRVTRYSETGESETITTTAETREEAQLQAAKYFAKKTVTIRPLTASQQLDIIRMCQRGNLGDALVNFLYFAIGETDQDFITDPRYIGVANEASWFCFIHSTPEYTEDARPFMENFLSGREALNIPLLQTAFKAYQTEHARAGLSLLPRQPVEPTPEEIDIESLSDTEIAQLKEASMLAYARDRQRGR
jgi:hypothetical protein